MKYMKTYERFIYDVNLYDIFISKTEEEGRIIQNYLFDRGFKWMGGQKDMIEWLKSNHRADEARGFYKYMKYLKTYNLFESKISYSAVVLDAGEAEKLLQNIDIKIPEGWEVIAHHMTIKLGELPEELKSFNYTPIKLKVTNVGMLNDMVMAIKVDIIQTSDASKTLDQYMKKILGFERFPKFTHITVAINRLKNAKPYMSNQINDFEKVNKEIYLNGKIEEVYESKKI